jgi:hypothetical protein
MGGNNLIQKFSAICLAIVMVVSTSYVVTPTTVHANDGIAGCVGAGAASTGAAAAGDEARGAPNVPSKDDGNKIKNIVNSAGNIANFLKECLLDLIFQIAKSAIIDAVKESVIEWIQGGFEGKPGFLQNSTNFFQSVASTTIGTFVEDYTDLAFLCEPFKLEFNFEVALQHQYYRDKSERSCSLEDIIDNIEYIGDFIQGEFSAGGLAGFVSYSQSPTGNPFNAFTKAETELAFNMTTAQGEEKDLLDWGRGFFSQKEKDLEGGGSGDGRGDDEGDGRGDDEGDGEGREEDNEVRTPGRVVEDQITQVVGSDLAQLISADEIGEAIAEIAGVLVGQLIQEGLAAASAAGNQDVYSDYRQQYQDRAREGREKISDAQRLGNNGLEQENAPNLARNVESDAIRSSGAPCAAVNPDNAVDGGTNGTIRDCNSSDSFQSDPDDDEAWWQIDLGAQESVYEIRISRAVSGGSGSDSDLSAEESFGEVKVFFSEKPFGEFFDPNNPPEGCCDSGIRRMTGDQQTIRLYPYAVGRYVRIQRMDKARGNYLSLAEVEIYENLPPVIELNGGVNVYLTVGDEYIDQGATATDITDEIVRGDANVAVDVDSSAVDTSVAGEYVVTYTAIDSAGAVATAERIVLVEEPF